MTDAEHKLYEWVLGKSPVMRGLEETYQLSGMIHEVWRQGMTDAADVVLKNNTCLPNAIFEARDKSDETQAPQSHSQDQTR